MRTYHRYDLPRDRESSKNDVPCVFMLVGTIAFVIGLSKALTWLMGLFGQVIA